ncbi:toxin HipA [Gammaproteobacteria bacterium 45_16_T64]|nr:toxin HipA [Gammaproteobacteria bacterium 45_16_T64]
MQNLAEVTLWGEQVGALSFDPERKLSTFEYASNWISGGVDIAPLHMPLSTQLYEFPQLNADTYKGLPAVFADSLPDYFGNAVIDAWLASNGRDPHSFSPLERLLYSGNRGMGALEYQPALRQQGSPTDAIELTSLVKVAQQILDDRAHLAESLGKDADNQHAMNAIFQVGTSAGGARPKVVIAVNPDRTEIRSGQMNGQEGFEHYLLKFDGVVEGQANSEVFGDPKGFGRMEYAYYLMAKDAGIDMSPSELLEEGERAHFMTKRFDRDGNKKLHYASLCAMDHADYKHPGSYSYEQLLTVARKLRLPRADAIEIFRRMVFNVVARNHDDHAKNFGFLLRSPTAKWQLSPAFDVAYSYKKGSVWVNSHQLSVNGKRDDFITEDLLAVSTLIGNFSKEAKEIINHVSTVVSEWDYFAKKAGVFTNLGQEIKHNHRLMACK